MPVERTFSAILFDNDGTCIDSTPGIIATISAWCRLNGHDPETTLPNLHGMRTGDVIRKYQTFPVPGSELTPSELASAVHREEMNVLQTSQHLSGGIVTLPGVKDLLSKLRKGGARWGIVTNATRVYATKMLEIAGVGEMPFLISGEDVKRGKPSPDPYLAGIEALNKLAGAPIERKDVLVVDDTPAGLESGRAAGCQTLAVCTSQSQERILACETTYRVVDLTRVEVVRCGPDRVTLRIHSLEEEMIGA